jgi:hypothetical protein
MAGKRSPEFLAIPMVAIAVVYGGTAYWAFSADTGLAWTVFILVNVAVIALALAVARRRQAPTSLPQAAPDVPDDGVYRPLVIVDAGGSAPALREQLVRSAAGRPAAAFVVAPALASRLDWVTGDQGAYDRATTELEATVAALEAAGIEAQGHIGARDPLQAAADGLREFPAEAIVIVSSAGNEASWLEEGLIEKLQEQAPVPVTHVIVDQPA